MKYSCLECGGHIEVDEALSDGSVACPHCQASSQFVLVSPDGGSPPPILGELSVAEVVGADQCEQAVLAAVDQVRGFCTAQEKVLRAIVQSRVLSLSIKPDVVAATNRRLIVLRRGVFSCRMWDALWVDVLDVKIEERLTGAVLSIRLTNGQFTQVEHLPKESARKFYQYCQQSEEAMRMVRFGYQIAATSAGAARVNVNVIGNQVGPPGDGRQG
jgi:hypothetical protein